MCSLLPVSTRAPAGTRRRRIPLPRWRSGKVEGRVIQLRYQASTSDSIDCMNSRISFMQRIIGVFFLHIVQDAGIVQRNSCYCTYTFVPRYQISPRLPLHDCSTLLNEEGSFNSLRSRGDKNRDNSRILPPDEGLHRFRRGVQIVW